MNSGDHASIHAASPPQFRTHRHVGPYTAMREAALGSAEYYYSRTMMHRYHGLTNTNSFADTGIVKQDSARSARTIVSEDKDGKTSSTDSSTVATQRLADTESILEDERRQSSALREENVRLQARIRIIETQRDAAMVHPLSAAQKSGERALTLQKRLLSIEEKLHQQLERNKQLVDDNERMRQALMDGEREKDIRNTEIEKLKEELQNLEGKLEEAENQLQKAHRKVESRLSRSSYQHHTSVSTKDKEASNKIESKDKTHKQDLREKAQCDIVQGDEEMILTSPEALQQLHRIQEWDKSGAFEDNLEIMQAIEASSSHLPDVLASSYLLNLQDVTIS